MKEIAAFSQKIATFLGKTAAIFQKSRRFERNKTAFQNDKTPFYFCKSAFCRLETPQKSVFFGVLFWQFLQTEVRKGEKSPYFGLKICQMLILLHLKP